ncbi:MAG: hypothetical protein M3N13_10640 [Candidatus Eremiobacteraeota bacterium]|nr:hypothetical protein [Candidatus Eremiobacteraeota bacterium]
MDQVTTYLDVDDVLEIYEALIGSAHENLRSRSLLESAVYAPQQSAFGEDAYPSVGQKAWAYLRGLAQNHASSMATSGSPGRRRARSCS